MTLYLLFVAGADQSSKTWLTYDAYVVYEGPVPTGATKVCAKLNATYVDDNNEARNPEGCVQAEAGYRRLLIRVPVKGAVLAYGQTILGITGSTWTWIPLFSLKTPLALWLPRPSYCNLGGFATVVQDFAGSFTRLLLSCGDTKCYWVVRSMRLIVDQIDDGASVTARLVAVPQGWGPEDGVELVRLARGTIGESRFGPLKGTALLGFGSPGSSLYLDITVEGGNAVGRVEVNLAGPYDTDVLQSLQNSSVTIEVYAIDVAGNRIDLASDQAYWALYSEFCFRDLEAYAFDGWLVKPP